MALPTPSFSLSRGIRVPVLQLNKDDNGNSSSRAFAKDRRGSVGGASMASSSGSSNAASSTSSHYRHPSNHVRGLGGGSSSPVQSAFLRARRASTTYIFSSTRHRARLLILAPLIYFALTLISDDRARRPFAIPQPLRAVLEPRPQEKFPLGSRTASPRNTASKQGSVSRSDDRGGSLVFLPEGFVQDDVSQFFCDILRVISNDDTEPGSRHQPIASQHITFAVPPRSSGLSSSSSRDTSESEELANVLRNTHKRKACWSPRGESTREQVEPSMSIVTITDEGVGRWLQSHSPSLVITSKESPYDATLARVQKSYRDDEDESSASLPFTWISMPRADLVHAGWIFSLSQTAVQAWHTPVWRVIVITNDRATSLRRLYDSLQKAHYFGDVADLTIRMDATADQPTLASAVEWTNASSTEPDRWAHGHSSVSFRFRQAGLITNIVEAWYPTSNNEYGFFFEDDIEASPFYFAYAKQAILTYRYGPESGSQAARNMYGVSLIQQKTSELDKKTGRIIWDAESRLKFHNRIQTAFKQNRVFAKKIKEALDNPEKSLDPDKDAEVSALIDDADLAQALDHPEDTVEVAKGRLFDVHSQYLSQVPSSWGAVFFPEHWREFHDYIQIRDSEELVPRGHRMVNPVLVSDNWEESWKRYLIELAFLRGYAMMYPNFADFISLSTNHVELGQHIDVKKQAQLRGMQEVPLMLENKLLSLPKARLPPIRELPLFDLWGKLVDSADVIVERGTGRHQELWDCEQPRDGVSNHDAYSLFTC